MPQLTTYFNNNSLACVDSLKNIGVLLVYPRMPILLFDLLDVITCNFTIQACEQRSDPIRMCIKRQHSKFNNRDISNSTWLETQPENGFKMCATTQTRSCGGARAAAASGNTRAGAESIRGAFVWEFVGNQKIILQAAFRWNCHTAKLSVERYLSIKADLLECVQRFFPWKQVILHRKGSLLKTASYTMQNNDKAGLKVWKYDTNMIESFNC